MNALEVNLLVGAVCFVLGYAFRGRVHFALVKTVQEAHAVEGAAKAVVADVEKKL